MGEAIGVPSNVLPADVGLHSCVGGGQDDARPPRGESCTVTEPEEPELANTWFSEMLHNAQRPFPGGRPG